MYVLVAQVPRRKGILRIVDSGNTLTSDDIVQRIIKNRWIFFFLFFFLTNMLCELGCVPNPAVCID